MISPELKTAIESEAAMNHAVRESACSGMPVAAQVLFSGVRLEMTGLSSFS